MMMSNKYVSAVQTPMHCRVLPRFLPAVCLSCFGVSALLLSISAHAGLSEVDITHSYEYQQTATATTLYGTFFAARAYQDAQGDFDTASLNYPGVNSPQLLSAIADDPPKPDYFGYGAPYQSADSLASEYGFGTYTFNVSNSSTLVAQSATIDYTQNAYTADIPALDDASFAALQGMDAAQSLTLNFGGFTPNAVADEAYLYFIVTDAATNTAVFSDFANLPSTTSEFLPGATLLAGHDYVYELIYDDRIDQVDAQNATPAQLLFDVRTFGNFSTAAPVPEPASWPLFAAGVGLVAARLRQRCVV
jgi:PEP-CTERM motif.